MKPLDAASQAAVIAAANVGERAGAKQFLIGWACPHAPLSRDNAEIDLPDEIGEDHNCPDVTWWVRAVYKKGTFSVEGRPDPGTAAIEFAEELLQGGDCRCGLLATVVDGDDPETTCRWRLAGDSWRPTCVDDSIAVDADRGDLGRMRHASLGRAARRRQDRLDKKRRRR